MSLRKSHHVFVCDNTRSESGRASCGARGSKELLEALRCAILADPILCTSVAVTGCDCLGPCFDGANVVVYPEAVWYAGVTAADVPELVTQHLRGGAPLARLLHPALDDEDE